MNALVIILLSLGFTAGILLSTMDKMESASNDVKIEKKEIICIDIDDNFLDKKACDSIFPTL